MNSENNKKNFWAGLIIAPIQFILALIVSLALIGGVGYASSWMTDKTCPICTSDSQDNPEPILSDPQPADDNKENPDQDNNPEVTPTPESE